MRSDFNKLLTERERIGHSDRYHQVRGAKGNKLFDEDARGGKESIHAGRRRSVKVNRKSFNENLNPLRYFIQSNVGRPWNKVFSELTAQFDRRKVVNNHIFEHLFRDFVEINAKVVNGKVCVLNSYRNFRSYDASTGRYSDVEEGYYERRWVPIKEDSTEWYVDPRDGILKLNTNRKTRRQKAEQQAADKAKATAKVFRFISDTEELHFHDGIWWLYTLAPRPAKVSEFGIPGYSDREFKALPEIEQRKRGRMVDKTPAIIENPPPTHHQFWNYTDYRRAGRSTMYYAGRSTASKKVLKANGLDGTAEFDEDLKPTRRELRRFN